MRPSTITAHAAGAALGSAVWLTGLHLAPGDVAWWLHAVGPAGCAGVALMSLLCAHHNAAMAAARRPRYSPAAVDQPRRQEVTAR